jgi:hypothetical protein
MELREKVSRAIFDRYRAFDWTGSPLDDGTRIYLSFPLNIRAAEILADAVLAIPELEAVRKGSVQGNR